MCNVGAPLDCKRVAVISIRVACFMQFASATAGDCQYCYCRYGDYAVHHVLFFQKLAKLNVHSVVQVADQLSGSPASLVLAKNLVINKETSFRKVLGR